MLSARHGEPDGVCAITMNRNVRVGRLCAAVRMWYTKKEGARRFVRRARTGEVLQMEIVRLGEEPALWERAAAWFAGKWSVPAQAYRDSIAASAHTDGVPQWYLALEDGRIIGGLGVIENDFHDRKDLAPNVCAVYTEPDRRCCGVAGALLRRVCADMARAGVDTLYLVTDHTSFYERYGWTYLCMANGDDGERMRLYIHRAAEKEEDVR